LRVFKWRSEVEAINHLRADYQEAASLSDPDHAVVIVVDDDASMRVAIEQLFTSAALASELYPSGPEMLARARLDRPGCIVLETRMPVMSGFEVHARLKQMRVELPVIFLAGSSDIPIAVAAMREGAADFIEKPFDGKDLVSRVRSAIGGYGAGRKDRMELREVWRKINSLTPRERSVLDLVVAGQSSKEIARTLEVSHRTIDIHRLHVMEKMGAPSLPDLVRMRLLAVERRVD
jgi:two-component system response regulator FixJ